MLLALLLYCCLIVLYANVWGRACERLHRTSINSRRKRIPYIYGINETAGEERSGAAHWPIPRVTLVIPCRDEARRIGPLLDTLSRQSLPRTKWEVVFVDDESTDSTAALIQDWIDRHPRIAASLLKAPPAGGKKAALSTGIAAASHPIILTTDADCRADSGWLAEMTAPFANASVQFALGPVIYESNGSLLQDMQRIESMGLVSLGAAAAIAGNPYLANGANFAFRRSAFDSVGGYRHGGGLASGDDTFLLEAFTQAGCHGEYVWDARALVWTQPPSSWGAYWRQNVRWLSKARASRNKTQRQLQVLGLLVWGGWWPLVLGLALGEENSENPKLFLILALTTVVRMLADWALTLPILQLAGLRRPWFNWLLAQLVYAAWVPLLGLRALWGGSYVWKGRRTR